jgi:alpha-L-fucosidase 2
MKVKSVLPVVLFLMILTALTVNPVAIRAANDVNVAVDWASFLSRSDLVWTSMPTSWNDAPFIGNGLIGTYLSQESTTSLNFEISRTDVFDHRNVDYSQNPGSGGSNLMFYEGRLPNGRFKLGYAGTNPTGNFRLNLWDAEVTGTVNTGSGSLGIRTFAHAADNVIVLEVTPTGGETGFTWNWYSDPSKTTRSGNPCTAYPAQTQEVLSGVNVSVQSMPDSATYQTAGKGEGQYATAWKIVDAGGGKKVIYISEGFSYPGTTAKQDAVNAVNNAASTGVASLESSHRAWWHANYPKSFFTIPTSKYESFYWIQIYKFLSATRGDRPILDLMGPWIKTTGWPGVWWNLNIQLEYWPMYMSNHTDVANALVENLYNNRTNLAANAAPNSSDSYAVGRNTSLGDRCDPGTEAGNLAYALNCAWQQYRATMDDTMLRNKLFPVMKGAFYYLNHKLYTGTDGKLHMTGTGSPEYTTNVEDCSYSLSLLRWLAKSIIQANTRLALNDPVATDCQNTLNNLTPYCTDATGFMVGKNMPLTSSHRHWSHLFMIYPLYEYTYDDSSQVSIINTSLNHWLGMTSAFQGYSWIAAASIYAMMGNGNSALTNYKTFLDNRPTPNTMYYEGGGPVIESPLFAARSMQDMVIASYNGIIRIFPGTADAWNNVEFDRFRVDGGFLVSAKRQNGVTKFIRIENTAGEPCKVKTGLSGTVLAYGNRTFNLTDLGSGVTQVDLLQGEWVVLYTGTLPALTIAPVAVTDAINYWGTIGKPAATATPTPTPTNGPTATPTPTPTGPTATPTPTPAGTPSPTPVWVNNGPTDFDGSTTYIDGGKSPGSASALTVAFRVTAHKLAYMIPVDKEPSSGTVGWTVKMRNNGDLWFRIGSNASYNDTKQTAVYSVGTEVHIACTFGSGTAKIYVNEQLKLTKTGITQTVNETATNLRLGIPSVAVTDEKLDGVLRDVKIYDRVLSDTEIAALAQ